MANGGHPWRLQAEIKRQKDEKREDGKKRKKKAEIGKCFQFPHDTQNEHRSGEVSVCVRCF